MRRDPQRLALLPVTTTPQQHALLAARGTATGYVMGIRLIVEVLDHAPADLTPAERLVLLVLAEDARDHTRMCWPGIEVIARRAGMGESGVRRVMLRLAGRGLDPRITSAHRGQRTVYRLPDLAPKGDTTVPPIDGKATPQSPKGDTSVSPSPSVPSEKKPSIPKRGPDGESHNGLDLTLQDRNSTCEHGHSVGTTRAGLPLCPLCRANAAQRTPKTWRQRATDAQFERALERARQREAQAP